MQWREYYSHGCYALFYGKNGWQRKRNKYLQAFLRKVFFQRISAVRIIKKAVISVDNIWERKIPTQPIVNGIQLLPCSFYFGVSIQSAYHYYVLMINIGTVFISYYCFSKMHNAKTGFCSIFPKAIYPKQQKKQLCGTACF